VPGATKRLTDEERAHLSALLQKRAEPFTSRGALWTRQKAVPRASQRDEEWIIMAGGDKE
jgi:hypothetical protein